MTCSQSHGYLVMSQLKPRPFSFQSLLAVRLYHLTVDRDDRETDLRAQVGEANHLSCSELPGEEDFKQKVKHHL